MLIGPQALRPRLPHPKSKGPIALVDDMRRETMQLSMPSSVEFLPREPQSKDQLANGERFTDMLVDS